MLKHKLYFAIIFALGVSTIFTNDFYSKFHQKDYKVDFQRAILVDYNKSVLNFVNIKTFKYNRTLPVINVTFNSKVSMGTELELEVQSYKFLSNEYRKLIGLSWQINLCKSIKANIGGLQIIHKCGNFTSCQIVQGTTYRICNGYPDESYFPPLIPNGEYKIQVNFLYYNEIIATIEMYAKIYRLVPIPKKP